jgi:hypothetical protein
MSRARRRVQISLGKLDQGFSLVYEGGFGVRNLLISDRALLENGYGAVSMRERLGGKLWWTLNLAVCGVGGVLMSL